MTSFRATSSVGQSDRFDGSNGDDALVGGPGADVVVPSKGADSSEPEGPES